MLQTTTEFDLKVNLPPKINLPSLLVAIFFKKQEVFVNKKEVDGHKKQKDKKNKDKNFR